MRTSIRRVVICTSLIVQLCAAQQQHRRLRKMNAGGTKAERRVMGKNGGMSDSSSKRNNDVIFPTEIEFYVIDRAEELPLSDSLAPTMSPKVRKGGGMGTVKMMSKSTAFSSIIPTVLPSLEPLSFAQAGSQSSDGSGYVELVDTIEGFIVPEVSSSTDVSVEAVPIEDNDEITEEFAIAGTESPTFAESTMDPTNTFSPTPSVAPLPLIAAAVETDSPTLLPLTTTEPTLSLVETATPTLVAETLEPTLSTVITITPTTSPVTTAPTTVPTAMPTTFAPTVAPTTDTPTAVPTLLPTTTPTVPPTEVKTEIPSMMPVDAGEISSATVTTETPTTSAPSPLPTLEDTVTPTEKPTVVENIEISNAPTGIAEFLISASTINLTAIEVAINNTISMQNETDGGFISITTPTPASSALDDSNGGTTDDPVNVNSTQDNEVDSSSNNDASSNSAGNIFDRPGPQSVTTEVPTISPTGNIVTDTPILQVSDVAENSGTGTTRSENTDETETSSNGLPATTSTLLQGEKSETLFTSVIDPDDRSLQIQCPQALPNNAVNVTETVITYDYALYLTPVLNSSESSTVIVDEVVSQADWYAVRSVAGQLLSCDFTSADNEKPALMVWSIHSQPADVAQGLCGSESANVASSSVCYIVSAAFSILHYDLEDENGEPSDSVSSRLSAQQQNYLNDLLRQVYTENSIATQSRNIARTGWLGMTTNGDDNAVFDSADITGSSSNRVIDSATAESSTQVLSPEGNGRSTVVMAGTISAAAAALIAAVLVVYAKRRNGQMEADSAEEDADEHYNASSLIGRSMISMDDIDGNPSLSMLDQSVQL